MAKVLAFKAVRYNPKVVGDLSMVVTQPYDRIGPKEEAEYLRRSPYNFVRLIGTKIPPKDDSEYAKRAELFGPGFPKGSSSAMRSPGFTSIVWASPTTESNMNA